MTPENQSRRALVKNKRKFIRLTTTHPDEIFDTMEREPI